MTITKRVLLFAAAALCVAGSQAHAVSLPANSSVLSTGAAVPVGGVTLVGGSPIAFTAATFSGTLTSSVISGDTSNPYGGLTFTYLLSNDAASAHAIGRLTINDFASFLVTANYQTPTGGQLPTLFDRSSGPGDTVGQSFIAPIAALPGFGQGTLAPGSTSALLVLQTDAIRFQPTLASVIDGSVASVWTYAPELNVPEPSTLALAAIGFVGLIGWQRRRQR